MPRKIAGGWSGPIDEAVRARLIKMGIDPNEVTGYKITRRVGTWPTLEVEMHFNDEEKNDG